MNIRTFGMLGIILSLTLAPGAMHAQTSIDVGADTDAMLKTSTSDKNMEADTNANGAVNLDLNVDGMETMEAGSENEAVVELRTDSSGNAVAVPADVSSDSDLEIFIYNVSAQHDRVVEAESQTMAGGESEMVIRYRHPGKLFGFIPVTVESKTTVTTDANGNVDARVDMPWWNVFVWQRSFDAPAAETGIKNNATVKANVKANATAQEKAAAIEAIVGELDAQTQLDADAELDVNTDSGSSLDVDGAVDTGVSL